MDSAELSEGSTCSLAFVISEADQRAFAALSGDYNPIHLDAEYAKKHGFASPVVYGAMLVAKLSQVVGMKFPGSKGLWSGVRMDFRHPLLVGQSAVLSVEVTQVSEATRSLILKAMVRADEKIIASGQAIATLLPETKK